MTLQEAFNKYALLLYEFIFLLPEEDTCADGCNTAKSRKDVDDPVVV